MKKLMNKIFMVLLVIGLFSCQDDFIDLDPLAQYTDAVYFKGSDDFKAFTASFYGNYLPKWSFNNMDINSDISANANSTGYDLGHGTISVPSSGGWDYSGIRNCNILLTKANEYTGEDDISQYVGEASFFRAFLYFDLLKTYGGVPIVTKVLDVDSEELYNPRNSRYEVVDLILADLDEAIKKLPVEQTIDADDKGRVSQGAAKSFKAQVLLYEATWEKYVGKTTDGDGVESGAGSEGYDANDVVRYLEEAADLALDVIENGGYSLWNQNDDELMENLSSWYLFNLEDAGSNPGGYDKTSNDEFILYNVYDYTYKQAGINLTWTSYQLYPSRKFVDMALCTDGLPPEKSSLFQGYHNVGDEFQNRDLRLYNYLYASTEPPTSISLDYGSLGYSGYENNKYVVYKPGPEPDGRRTDGTESANLPIIRLAEVYLIYAEAMMELNGEITDEQLDISINKLRDRAGVAHLTNSIVMANDLDLLTEIRRERTVELYREGKRFDDLKRWGILEETLNPSRLGMVVGDGVNYATAFKDTEGNATEYYSPSSYVYGEEAVETPDGTLNCVVIDSKNNHNLQKKHYLWPLSQLQIDLNDKLLQNPGY